MQRLKIFVDFDATRLEADYAAWVEENNGIIITQINSLLDAEKRLYHILHVFYYSCREQFEQADSSPEDTVDHHYW